jgi:hypothetical protein
MNNPLFLDSSLPPELDDRVRREVRDGERLLWVGQPKSRRFLLVSIPIVLFGIPWTGFAIFWVAMASSMVFGGLGQNQEVPGGFGLLFSCFPLFGIPFVLIGFGMLSAPYWMWRHAKKTCYALTDQRAILWQPSFWSGVEVRSYGPESLGKTVRTEYADGSGDLIFEEFVTIGSDSDGHRTRNTTRHGFHAIENVAQVDELLRKALLPPPSDESAN